MDTLTADLDLLVSQADALLASERNPIANAANLSALIFSQLPGVNWVGFYFTSGGQKLQGEEQQSLLIGPFQGQPACIRLPWGRGVCGTAAATRSIQRVDDVHAFEGHITCDSASRSELVVPLLCNDEVLGVLDIDSPLRARFSQVDADGMEQLSRLWLQHSNTEILAHYR